MLVRQSLTILVSISLIIGLMISLQVSSAEPELTWSEQEITAIQSLAIDKLPAPNTASNRFAQRNEAAALGKSLFFDKQLSRNHNLSCATCHQPERFFSDGRSIAIGSDIGKRNTPSLHGAAWNHWQFWDGRKDSLWSQALAPLENPLEHRLTRTEVIQRVLNDPKYREPLQQLGDFPLNVFSATELASLPAAQPEGNIEEILAWKQLTLIQRDQIDGIFADLGKLMAAYVTTLPPLPSRFDQFVQALTSQQPDEAAGLLNPAEQAGLRLFISQRAQCINCHSGPLLTNQSFHSIGTGRPGTDSGRAAAIDRVRLDRFNCLGKHSDAKEKDCGELKYMQRDRHGLRGAFRTPSLRNVANTAPYFHDGRATQLEDVIAHYQQIDPKSTDMQPIHLTEAEVVQLAAFLRTLSATSTPSTP